MAFFIFSFTYNIIRHKIYYYYLIYIPTILFINIVWLILKIILITVIYEKINKNVITLYYLFIVS